MAGLINDVITHGAQARHAYILALDDYHVIETKQVHESLDYLLDHLPP